MAKIIFLIVLVLPALPAPGSVVTMAECTVFDDLGAPLLTNNSATTCGIDFAPGGRPDSNEVFALAGGSIVLDSNDPYTTSLSVTADTWVESPRDTGMIFYSANAISQIEFSATTLGPVKAGFIEIGTLIEATTANGGAVGVWNIGGIGGTVFVENIFPACTNPLGGVGSSACAMGPTTFPFTLGAPFGVLLHLVSSAATPGSLGGALTFSSASVTFRLMELDGTSVPLVTEIPEPQTWSLVMVGLTMLVGIRQSFRGRTKRVGLGGGGPTGSP